MRAACGQRQDEVPLVSGNRLSGVGRCCARCSARSGDCKVGGGEAENNAAVAVIARALAADNSADGDAADLDVVPSQPALAAASSAVPRAQHIPFVPPVPPVTPPLEARVSPLPSSVEGVDSDVEDLGTPLQASPQPAIRIHSRSPSPVTVNKRSRDVRYEREVLEDRLARLRAEYLVLDTQIEHLEGELSVLDSAGD